MVAEFFLTVFATDAFIGGIREAFGVKTECDLPAQQKKERERQKCPRIGARDEDERGKHHREIPVIDAAIGAATVFHEPSLEGAEKQNANEIADTISEGDEDEDARVDDLQKVKCANRSVQKDPSRRHREGANARYEHGFGFARRNVVARKLLLATGAFEL